MAPTYSKEELAELTDEEREGFKELEAEAAAEEADDGDEGDAAEKASAADRPAPGDDGQADDGAAADGAAPAKDAAAPAPAVADAAPAAATSSFPQYEMPENYDARVKAIEDQRDALAQKFDDGEITAAEFNKSSRALDTEFRQIDEQRLRAEISYDARIETWKASVSSFLERHPQYEPGTPLYQALDAQVVQLQKQATNGFDPKLLDQAHAAIDAQIRKAAGLPPATAPAPGAAKPAAPAAAQAAKSAVGDIPPTLAHVPAAAHTPTDDQSEFAFLDRLQARDPEKYEEALAKLSDEQRERYEAGG